MLANTRIDVLVTPSHVARYFGVTASTVSKWRQRHEDFPHEVKELRTNDNRLVNISGELTVFLLSGIIEWGERHGKRKAQ